MNAQLRAIALDAKVYALSNKPVIGAVVGAVVAVALPTLSTAAHLYLIKKPVVEEAVKATKSAVIK